MQVAYRIGAAAPASHLFDVIVEITDINDAEVILRLPAWIPGSYMIRDYARHVVAMQARDPGGVLESVRRLDKSSWQISASGAELTVLLQVYAWDVSVRGAHLDTAHAYFNGVCVFPEVLGATPGFDVEIDRPSGLPVDVVVATSLQAITVDAAGFGRYRVRDYDELIDHPVEIAVQTRVEFTAADVPHSFYVRGAGNFDEARLTREVARVCEEHHALLGTPTDLDRYVFMAYALGQGYGGLEHRWSTSLEISRGDLPQTGPAHDPRAWRKCLGLISHEYFHLWNVRRLKPAAFMPMDLQRENHTGLLWVFEGITSYYDDLVLARSGVISEQEYLELLGETLTRVQRTPGRWRQSLEDSSFDAWTRFYKQDANAANAIISYYAKGAVAALVLDLTLRSQTQTTLDDVMRACWQRYYVDDDSGMPERGLEVVASELAGRDLNAFFDTWIRGTEDVDLARLLATVGIGWHTRAQAPGDDAGGKAAAAAATSWAGVRFDGREPGRVAAVMNGSPAERAGLAPGDVVVALGERRFSVGAVELLLLRGQQGDAVTCHAFRGDTLLESTLVLMAPPEDTVWLTFRADVAPEALERRTRWLASNAG